MNVDRIDNYWSDYFGIEKDEIGGDGLIVVPHNHLEGYNGAWIFKRKHRLILSVKSNLINKISAKINKKKPEGDNLFSKLYLDYVFDEKIDRIIGPTYQGYFDDVETDIQLSKKVDKINFKEDYNLIERLSKSGDNEGWANSGINRNNDGIYGYFHENKMESIACYNIIRGDVGFVGVYTNPKFRGMGFSYEVVKNVVSDLSIKGKLIIYQTLISNKPSIRIAKKIGFEEYAANIAIRLKK